MALVDEEYLEEIEKARRQLRLLITINKCAPLMLRLAWNDACTYDAQTRTGGANASIRTPQELKHQANIGLERAVRLCEEVKAKLKKVSYADLYQLAGVVAIELTGGPTINFYPGRQDSDECPPEGRHLSGEEDAKSLRNTFSRMGLRDDKHIVALCGGVRTISYTKGPYGQWTKDPLKFDNSYFVLPMDDALVKDEKFRHFVELYAKDEDTFFKDYAMSHEKLSELGCNLKKPNQPKGSFEKLNQPKGLIGIGLVSLVVTVILGYLMKKRKKNQLKVEEDLDTNL
uniref:L-ascorbate peroxidase 3, peroxisomal n=1 Tax=Cajanus cajan TaxID=3821 RepID=A0A151THZ7_CAJCA|nr:L-ascorbate peroxidase 3, peroxisomal [Cajanus cajan]